MAQPPPATPIESQRTVAHRRHGRGWSDGSTSDDVIAWHLNRADTWRRDAAINTSFAHAPDAGLDPAVVYARAAWRRVESDLADALTQLSSPSADVALVVGTSKGPFVRTLCPSPAVPWVHDVVGPLVELSPTLATCQAAGRLETRCVVAACATGLRAVLDAARLVATGRCDIAIALASDASIHPLSLAAYQRLGVLSPRGVCDAWQPSADGFFVGEGAGALVLTARPIPPDRLVNRRSIRLAGWASAADPGLVAGETTGHALSRLISRAIARAGWDRVPDRLKPHGTGTPTGDASEQAALSRLGASWRGVSAPSGEIYLPKRELGHTLGAAGVVELIAWLAELLRDEPAGHEPGQTRALTWSAGFGGSLEGLALDLTSSWI